MDQESVGVADALGVEEAVVLGVEEVVAVEEGEGVDPNLGPCIGTREDKNWTHGT